jgi:hypothetical protein
MVKQTIESLSDEELLERRMCDLGITVADTDLESAIAQLYDELSAKGVTCHPPCYLGDEWFCEENTPAVSLPFYLAHPRLRQLEQHMMLEVEGGSPDDLMRYLRHETGHAIMYAYRLNRRQRFRRLFGSSSQPYTDRYHHRPYSKNYVIHLKNWYAQSHPDEDFAETFAVWLTPDAEWKSRYRGWGAIEKLKYCDFLMTQTAGKSPPVTTTKRPYAVTHLRRRLKTHYQQRRKAYASDFPDFFDNDLRRLFADRSQGKGRGSAAQFLRRNRRQLFASVAQWTGARKYNISLIHRRLVIRCQELRLVIVRDEEVVACDAAAFLTAVTMNHLQQGQCQR